MAAALAVKRAGGAQNITSSITKDIITWRPAVTKVLTARQFRKYMAAAFHQAATSVSVRYI